jgi:hypothetical protein
LGGRVVAGWWSGGGQVVARWLGRATLRRGDGASDPDPVQAAVQIMESGLGRGNKRDPRLAPLHPKHCLTDEEAMVHGSFNGYNMSVFSNDITVLASHREFAQACLHEFSKTKRRFRLF